MTIINLQNPFRGELSIRDGLGRIFWGEEPYFHPVKLQGGPYLILAREIPEAPDLFKGVPFDSQMSVLEKDARRLSS